MRLIFYREVRMNPVSKLDNEQAADSLRRSFLQQSAKVAIVGGAAAMLAGKFASTAKAEDFGASINRLEHIFRMIQRTKMRTLPLWRRPWEITRVRSRTSIT